MSLVAEIEISVGKFYPLQILELTDGRNRAHRTADGAGYTPAENLFFRLESE